MTRFQVRAPNGPRSVRCAVFVRRQPSTRAPRDPEMKFSRKLPARGWARPQRPVDCDGLRRGPVGWWKCSLLPLHIGADGTHRGVIVRL